MAAQRIGVARCLLCGSVRARLSLSKAGLACLTCDRCNLQCFARSGTSDEKLRALHIPADDAAAVTAAAARQAAGAELVTRPTPAPTPPPAPSMGWGVLAGLS